MTIDDVIGCFIMKFQKQRNIFRNAQRDKSPSCERCISTRMFFLWKGRHGPSFRPDVLAPDFARRDVQHAARCCNMYLCHKLPTMAAICVVTSPGMSQYSEKELAQPPSQDKFGQCASEKVLDGKCLVRLFLFSRAG